MVSMNLPFSLFRHSLISIFCSPWGPKESDITDQLNWTELISIFPSWEKLFARTRGTWFQYFKNIFKRDSIYHLKLAYILAWKFLCWGCGGYFSYFQSKDGIERWTVQQIPNAKWAWIDLFRAGFLNLRTVVICCCSVTKSYPTLQPQGLQHASLPCPSLSPWVCSNTCPLSQWYYTTISSSVASFSSCLQSFPASGSFPMCQFFTSGGQSIGASASFGARQCFVEEKSPVHCKLFSSIPLSPLDARSTPPVVTNKCLQTLTNITQGAKSPLVHSYWLI